MGLICAKWKRDKQRLQYSPDPLPACSTPSVSKVRPVLTPETKKLILSSFAIIKKHVERVGVVMFIGLLENPEFKGTFKEFKDRTTDELRDSVVLKTHVLRVMEAVEKVIARMDSNAKVISFLHELGKKHLGYNANPEFLPMVGPHFIIAIQPVLKEKWTPEMEKAWTDLFDYITFLMKESMVEDTVV